MLLSLPAQAGVTAPQSVGLRELEIFHKISEIFEIFQEE